MYQILDQGKNFFEPQQPRRPVREHVPLWLRWALIFFILTNIGSFIATTVITVMNIDGIIEKLVSKGQLSHEDLRRVKQHEARRAQLMVATTVEVLMDVVDLFNVFFGSYAAHVVYLAMKILSVGLWTYTQTAVGESALWIIPIGLAILVAVVLLEWFAQLRKCALVALILVGSVAWIAVVTLRLQQISHEIADAEEEMTRTSGQTADGRKAKARLEAKISDWQTSQQEMVIYSAAMLLFGTLSLVVLFCLADCLCLGFTVASMQLVGVLAWVGKLLLTDHEPLDFYFSVPLAYSVLSCLVLFGHLGHAVVFGKGTTTDEQLLSGENPNRTEKTAAAGGGVKTRTKDKDKGKDKGGNKKKEKAAAAKPKGAAKKRQQH